MDMNVKCSEVVTNIEGSELTVTLKNPRYLDGSVLEDIAMSDILEYLKKTIEHSDIDEILELMDQKEIATYCDRKGLL